LKSATKALTGKTRQGGRDSGGPGTGVSKKGGGGLRKKKIARGIVTCPKDHFGKVRGKKLADKGGE